MATLIHLDSSETGSIADETVLEVEYPVQLAHTSEPALRLAGTVSVIRPGRRDLALSDQEWRELGLEAVPDAG